MTGQGMGETSGNRPWGGAPHLQGVKVIDASTFISGPVTGRALSDLGAEVIKVEPPMREAFFRFAPLVGGTGASYTQANLGKSLLLLDLKEGADMARFKNELVTSDVLITNWRPGVDDRLGINAETVRQLNPDLIWCRITGFGQDGPDAGTPAFDTVIQGRSGLTFTQGQEEPSMVRMYLVDKITAMTASQAILAALVERQSGRRRGAVVDVSMLDSLAWFNSFDVLAQRVDPAQSGDQINRTLQNIRPLPTSDGWILVAPARVRQLSAAFTVAGHPEWLESLRGKTTEQTSKAVFDLLATVTPERTSEDWIRALKKADVPVSEVMDLDQHLSDPQVVHNGTYVTADWPGAGPLRAARWPGLTSP